MHQDRVFNADHHGSRKTLKVGDEFSVVLESNPSTGFEWIVESIDGLLGPRYGRIPDLHHRLVGQGGKQTFTWTVERAGIFTIDMKYKRRWEDRVASQFTLTIEALEP